MWRAARRRRRRASRRQHQRKFKVVTLSYLLTAQVSRSTAAAKRVEDGMSLKMILCYGGTRPSTLLTSCAFFQIRACTAHLNARTSRLRGILQNALLTRQRTQLSGGDVQDGFLLAIPRTWPLTTRPRPPPPTPSGVARLPARKNTSCASTSLSQGAQVTESHHKSSTFSPRISVLASEALPFYTAVSTRSAGIT